LKILFKYPTRQRPEWFKETLNKYYEYMNGNHRFIITCDIDDDSMNNDEMRAFMDNKPNLTYHFGSSRTKIEACNADIEGEFDILVVVSDDMVPIVKGFDDVIIKEMQEHFPNLDGALDFPDGFNNNLITYSILGRKLYEYFGYVYYHGYRSFWCDNEFTERVKAIGKYAYIDNLIVRHEWVFMGDVLYRKNQMDMKHDEMLYLARRPGTLMLNSVKSGIPTMDMFHERRAESRPMDLDVCRRNLLDLKTAFGRTKFWLMFGTLLGAIRDNNFIAHDTDTDVGVFREDLVAICDALANLESLGFTVVRTQGDLLASVMRDGEYIDLHFYKKVNKTAHGPLLTIPHERLGAAEIDFLGTKFPIPSDPVELLERQYGDDWQIPIKGRNEVPL